MLSGLHMTEWNDAGQNAGAVCQVILFRMQERMSGERPAKIWKW